MGLDRACPELGDTRGPRAAAPLGLTTPVAPTPHRTPPTSAHRYSFAGSLRGVNFSMQAFQAWAEAGRVVNTTVTCALSNGQPAGIPYIARADFGTALDNVDVSPPSAPRRSSLGTASAARAHRGRACAAWGPRSPTQCAAFHVWETRAPHARARPNNTSRLRLGAAQVTEYLKSKGVCDNQACTFRINDATNRGPRMDETLRVEVRCLCPAGMVRGAGVVALARGAGGVSCDRPIGVHFRFDCLGAPRAGGSPARFVNLPLTSLPPLQRPPQVPAPQSDGTCAKCPPGTYRGVGMPGVP